MLCTSHAMMRDLAEQFRATMTLPVLLQGKPVKANCYSNLLAPATRCSSPPAASGKGGRARRYVIFGDYRQIAVYLPDDPLLKARMEDCRLRGGDPFDEVQLPDAVITLKQGWGG